MANPPPNSLIITAKNWLVLLVLLIVPAVGGLGYVLWELHTPKPRIRTPITITRNSLLPHRFAGICENCHQILDIGPVEMSKDNMRLFNLTFEQRQLLVAGQRVDAPSLLQRLRVPAISRSDSLPHPYVGVCSNCHLILDIKPTQEFRQRAMRRAYQPLILSTAMNERVAHGGVRERDTRETLRNVFGFSALALFLGSCVFIVMRFLLKTYPHVYKGKFKIKPWFVAHEWFSVAFCIATILHWHFSDRGNTFLHVALLLVIWLTLAGYVLRYRLASKEANKSLRLLHTQQYMFLGLIVLVVIGHLFAEFY